MISVEHILNDTDYLSCLSADEVSKFSSNVVDVCLRAVTTVLNILSLTCDSKGKTKFHIYVCIVFWNAEVPNDCNVIGIFGSLQATQTYAIYATITQKVVLGIAMWSWPKFGNSEFEESMYLPNSIIRKSSTNCAGKEFYFCNLAVLLCSLGDLTSLVTWGWNLYS